MKNVFKATLFFAMVILMSACGSSAADAGNFVGEWIPDVAKTELNLSEAIPAEYRVEIESKMANKDDMAEAQKQAEKALSIEFKEDGKLIVGAEGESQEMDWEIDGSTLKLKGKVEMYPVNIELEIVESAADAFTIKLTGTSILEQVEKQLGGMMSIDEGLDYLQSMARGQLDGIELKTAIEESSLQMTFNRK